MNMESKGWSRREVDASKRTNTEFIERARKGGLEEEAKSRSLSLADLNSIQMKDTPDGQNSVEGTLNGVHVSIARVEAGNKGSYSGTVDGALLLESDARDMYFIIRGIAHVRDRINNAAIRDSVDVIDDRLRDYERTVGVLRDKALGKLLNPSNDGQVA